MHAIDTEYVANSTDPVPQLVSVAIAGPSGAGLFVAHDPSALVAVRHVLSTGAVFAMAPADIFAVWRQWPELLPDILDAYENDRVIDVLTCEKLIDIAEGEHFRRGTYGLAAVARRRAGIELAKEDTFRLRYGELLGLSLEQWPAAASEYALKDAEVTLAIYLEQRAFAARFSVDILGDAYRQARAHLALYAQTLRGLATDPAQVRYLDERLTADIERFSGECVEAGLARWQGKKTPKLVRNTKAAAAMLEAFATVTGQPVERTDPTAKHPTGQVSLAEGALERLSLPEGHPLDAYRRLGATKSMRTGWIGPLSHPVVHTRYDECVGSGRTSSSGFDDSHHWGPCSRNLQNFPQEDGYRRCIRARLGKLLVVSDYSAVELVALGQVQLDWFGRSALADAMRSGRDPHGEFAARLLGIPYEQFDKKNPAHARMRKLAKAWNFGKPGGMGAKRFIAWAKTAYGVEVTLEEERQYTAAWHAQWPEMRMYFQEIDRMQGSDGLITLIQPRSNRARGGLRYPDACNTNFQGLAADGAKAALWQLFRAGLDPASPMFGSHQVLFVHDEIVTEAPEDRAEQARDEQERIMKAAFAHWCPDVPVGVESIIDAVYSK